MRIYLDTQAKSLSDLYIVKLLVAKDYRNASAYQSQFFFYAVRRVLSFERLLSTCMFLRAESSLLALFLWLSAFFCES